MNEAVILSGVSKRFEQKQRSGFWRDRGHKTIKCVYALDDVSFSVKPGEFVAYAGPNGAGKSTTFKLLCGLLAPDAGEVRALGLDPIRQRIPLMKRCGVLFGNRTEMWWDHPVITSFEWKKEVWGISDARYRDMYAYLRDKLDLAEIEHTFVRELSLGQRMRADVALAFLHQPELMLMDEPTLGLDVLVKRHLIGFLKSINRERGVTLIVTSHDMDDLTEMANRLILLAGGKIAFDGTDEELKIRSGDRRLVRLTRPGGAVQVPGLQWTGSEGDVHSYSFDASSVSVADMLRKITIVDGLQDVETARAPIEGIIADLYDSWKKKVD